MTLAFMTLAFMTLARTAARPRSENNAIKLTARLAGNNLRKANRPRWIPRQNACEPWRHRLGRVERRRLLHCDHKRRLQCIRGVGGIAGQVQCQCQQPGRHRIKCPAQGIEIAVLAVASKGGSQGIHWK
tara:strand:+ start:393 stop:779 length:387 start_codon:yes stop_codon:yes gene_type:complete